MCGWAADHFEAMTSGDAVAGILENSMHNSCWRTYRDGAALAMSLVYDSNSRGTGNMPPSPIASRNGRVLRAWQPHAMRRKWPNAPGEWPSAAPIGKAFNRSVAR